MKDLSVDWAEYARAQDELKQSRTSNDRHWGLENALNKTLDDIEKGSTFDRSDIERHIRSGSRRNRHRARLVRLEPITWLPSTVNPTLHYEARSELAFLHNSLDGNSLTLACKVAGGHYYSELAQAEGVGIPALRKRVSRLRIHARALLPKEQSGPVAL